MSIEEAVEIAGHIRSDDKLIRELPGFGTNIAAGTMLDMILLHALATSSSLSLLGTGLSVVPIIAVSVTLRRLVG